jgi:hypothetical protein
MSKTSPIPTSYSPPLDQLLNMGQPIRQVIEFDCEALEITHEHVPELIRMLDDEELNNASGESNRVWGPLYAWRALGALKAEEAIGPLLGLLKRIDEHQDDWVGEDVPQVLAVMGSAAMAPTVEYLANPVHDDWARIAAAKTLGLIGQQHPELRDDCVRVLRAQLGKHAEQSEGINAFLISPLLDLKAIEALPEMKEASDAGHVDETVGGDFEDFEIELGLKAVRTHPPKPNKLTVLGERLRALVGHGGLANEPLGGMPVETSARVPVASTRIGRNDPCPCGSGKKYKKCCGKT